MVVLFLGGVFTKSEETELFKYSKIGLQQAANTMQWNIIKGIEQNLGHPIRIISFLPVGSFPIHYKKAYLKKSCVKRSGEDYIQLGCLNIIGVKQLSKRLLVYRELNKQIKQSKNERIKILIYPLYPPYISACSKLKKKYGDRIMVCPVITELPSRYGIKKNDVLTQLFDDVFGMRSVKEAREFDSFVILTEQICEPLNIKDKPHVVVEGIADPECYSLCNVTKEVKTVLYAGTLYTDHSIEVMLEAFHSIPDKDYKFLICGDGAMRQSVLDMQKIDQRIRFLGYLPQEKVRKLQYQATVLINPRQDTSEFTKYSFPSKTMEYMLSGTPVIMYRLAGVPIEYYDYVYTPKDNSAVSLKELIMQVCETSFEKREGIGRKAREFIIQNKTPLAQCKRIIDMWNEHDKV